MKNQLGMSLSSMGPATARPVFRGYSGNKIGFMINGVGVSDLSSTSPDHALTINPLAIKKVELSEDLNCYCIPAILWELWLMLRMISIQYQKNSSFHPIYWSNQ